MMMILNVRQLKGLDILEDLKLVWVTHNLTLKGN